MGDREEGVADASLCGVPVVSASNPRAGVKRPEYENLQVPLPSAPNEVLGSWSWTDSIMDTLFVAILCFVPENSDV